MKKKDSEKTIFVTQDNYYSNEMAKIYTGSTQIKLFLQCESKAMAELNGEWQEETSKPQLTMKYSVITVAAGNSLKYQKRLRIELPNYCLFLLRR